VTRLAYDIVDVFTDRPFAGNPLAVVYGGEHLDTSQMQAMAREFHLSETVFVLPSTMEGADYRLRIFTPEAELQFAGHPSVGSAVAQHRRGMVPAGQLHQETGVGVLPIFVHPDGRATLTGGAATIGAVLSPTPYLACAGLSEADLAGSPICMAGCGLEFPFVSVTPDAVTRAVPTPVPGVREVYIFSWDAERRLAHARLFAPQLGIAEDAATGSAALALGVWLANCGLVPADGETTYTVRQGIEIHRPSTMECAVSTVDGQVVRTTVTGMVMPIASGEIAVPPFLG